MESKEKIGQDLLWEIAKALKVLAEAILNFDDEKAVNIIANTFHDDAVACAEYSKCT